MFAVAYCSDIGSLFRLLLSWSTVGWWGHFHLRRRSTATVSVDKFLFTNFRLRTTSGNICNLTILHSRPQGPRSFWPVAGIESSGRTRFSEHAQSISFVLSTNQIWQIWREVRESRTSGVGQSQSSRFLPQARRIVGSGDENGLSLDGNFAFPNQLG